VDADRLAVDTAAGLAHAGAQRVDVRVRRAGTVA